MIQPARYQASGHVPRHDRRRRPASAPLPTFDGPKTGCDSDGYGSLVQYEKVAA